jgi:membrane-bound ClpP family serine protease
MENKTTYSQEYIEDRKKIDTLARSMQNQINQLNKRLTDIQITDFKLAINQAADVKQKLTFKRKFYLWIVRKLSVVVKKWHALKLFTHLNSTIIKHKFMLQFKKPKAIK